jgi:hypothetical protein
MILVLKILNHQFRIYQVYVMEVCFLQVNGKSSQHHSITQKALHLFLIFLKDYMEVVVS